MKPSARRRSPRAARSRRLGRSSPAGRSATRTAATTDENAVDHPPPTTPPIRKLTTRADDRRKQRPCAAGAAAGPGGAGEHAIREADTEVGEKIARRRKPNGVARLPNRQTSLHDGGPTAPLTTRRAHPPSNATSSANDGPLAERTTVMRSRRCGLMAVTARPE